MKWIAFGNAIDSSLPVSVESLRSLCIRVLRSNSSRLDSICRRYARRNESSLLSRTAGASSSCAEDHQDPNSANESGNHMLLRAVAVHLDRHLVLELIAGIDNVEVLQRMLAALRLVSPDVDLDEDVGRAGWRKIVDSKHKSRGDRFICPFGDAVRLVHLLLTLVEASLGLQTEPLPPIGSVAGYDGDDDGTGGGNIYLGGPVGLVLDGDESAEGRFYLLSLLPPEHQHAIAPLLPGLETIANTNSTSTSASTDAPSSKGIKGDDSIGISSGVSCIEAIYTCIWCIRRQVTYSTVLLRLSGAGTRMRRIAEEARRKAEAASQRVTGTKRTPGHGTAGSTAAKAKGVGAGGGSSNKSSTNTNTNSGGGSTSGDPGPHSMADVAALAKETAAWWKSIYRAGTAASESVDVPPSNIGSSSSSTSARTSSISESSGSGDSLRELFELGGVYESSIHSWLDLLRYCDCEEARRRDLVVARMRKRKAEEEAAVRLSKTLALAPAPRPTSTHPSSSASKPFVSIRQMYGKEVAQSSYHAASTSSSSNTSSRTPAARTAVGTQSTVRQQVVRTPSGAVMTLPRRFSGSR